MTKRTDSAARIATKRALAETSFVLARASATFAVSLDRVTESERDLRAARIFAARNVVPS